MAIPLPTPERLATQISYCPETGDFYRLTGHLAGRKTGCAMWKGYIRLVNLRLLDAAENSHHRRRDTARSSVGILGVSIDKRNSTNPFVAQITVRGEKDWIGSYPTPAEAQAAYEKAKSAAFPELS